MHYAWMTRGFLINFKIEDNGQRWGDQVREDTQNRLGKDHMQVQVEKIGEGSVKVWPMLLGTTVVDTFCYNNSPLITII
jgi:hypothetical protein